MAEHSLSDYKVIDVIGSGSFAKVSKVRRKSTNQVLVWKELDYGKMRDKEKQMLCDEVNILRALNHPNIVRFSTYLIDHTHRKIFIIQEYCDGGDLASYIRNKKDTMQHISECFIWSVLTEISQALRHCHDYGGGKDTRVLHRDLKPSNIFLCRRGSSYSVKLGDFGLAKVLNQSLFAQTHVGTPYYMSPEQVTEQCYNQQSDVWSLGAVLYEMATLSPPFRAMNYIQLALKIQQGKYRAISAIQPSLAYSKALENVVDRCLKVDPQKRITVEQILELPRVHLQIKQIKLDKKYQSLKKKEEQMKKREASLRALEHRLALKEVELLRMERDRSSKCGSHCNGSNISSADSVALISNTMGMCTLTTTTNSSSVHSSTRGSDLSSDQSNCSSTDYFSYN